MEKNPDTMQNDSTPRASLGNDEADQAGSCISFPKRALSIDELIVHLHNKGLNLYQTPYEDVVHLLRTHGYYRLRGFWATLEKDGRFIPGCTLSCIEEIERFDAALSGFLFDLIAPVEIAFRACFSQEISEQHGPEALDDDRLFADKTAFDRMRRNTKRECAQGRESKLPFVLHNLEKYGRLPIWASVELMSLGTISKAYGNLASPALKQRIAATFNLKARYLENWMRYATQIRNMCAHHDRLYNHLFPMRPALFKEHAKVDNARLFAAFIVLFRLNDAIDPKGRGARLNRLARMMDEFRNVDMRPVGFPNDWKRIIGIPDVQNETPRPRGRAGGRPSKSPEQVEQALYLYDMRAGTVREICRSCGISAGTLYKYIKLREEE